MAANKVELVAKHVTTLGEGPHWSIRDECLYFIDILNPAVGKYDPSTHQTTMLHFKDEVAATLVVPVANRANEFVVARGRSIVHLKWRPGIDTLESVEERELVSVDDCMPKNRFNDGKCDALGRLYAGTMGYEDPERPGEVESEAGTLYRIDGQGSEGLVSKLDLSNGLGFDRDNKLMYYVDTKSFRVDVFDFDLTMGKLSNRRVVFDLKDNGVEGFPDGLAIDDQGHVWLALFSTSTVVELDPLSKSIVSKVTFPVKNVTSVAFGGKNMTDLYVTTACTGDKSKLCELSGSIFVVKDLKNGHGKRVRGLPHHEFNPDILQQLMKKD